MIAVSIVSHGHGDMVVRLVSQLLACTEVSRIVITLNVPEILVFPESERLQVVLNSFPKGFGENHNQAFRYAEESYFCPLNPDITLQGNLFPRLLALIEETGSAVAAPCVVSPEGFIEDSVRRFPTLSGLAAKVLKLTSGKIDFDSRSAPFFPDWVAGMFMLFRRDAFAALRGFDEGFFLYYEDVDICVRAWRAGLKIVFCPSVSVVHDAQRNSHRNLRHLRWHLGSMLRYFTKHLGRLPRMDRACH